ncbi:MAG TPA: YceI family protein [Polyangia bacterium]|nr:YceI family protein [Polyangia bacterium]
MRLAISALLLARIFATPARADEVLWTLDPNHTSVEFSVEHMLVSRVRGVFLRVSGSGRFDSADRRKSSIEVVIDTASLSSNQEARDAHLKSDAFFDVKQFPSMVFKSRRVEIDRKGRVRMFGDLTIKNVTREVELEVKGPTAELKDLDGHVRIGASATCKLDRRDFGLTWNRKLESGGLLVGHEVLITIETEFIKKQPESSVH